MTKCIEIGVSTKDKVKKPIIFKVTLEQGGEQHPAISPSCWKNIELIARNYGEEEHKDLDLMYAYNHVISDGCLYLGKWNDGFVKDDE